MDVLTNLDAPQSSTLNERIRPTDLKFVLDHYADKIKVLSLDCFDTLLWRKSASPVDVFYDLEQYPTFQSLGITAILRFRAEADARMMKNFEPGSNEIQLKDIYQSFSADLNETQLDALAKEELAAEVEACYPFPPIMELIRKAHALGLKIIIVSDTYFKHAQLQHLLKSTLPTDVMAAIDTIFCSCEHGKSKVNGLFNTVLEKLNVPAQSVLHLGDNAAADFRAARALELHALHLIHHDDKIDEMLRMQTSTTSLFDPTIRNSRSCTSPYRGVLASAELNTQQPEQIIGFATLGPIMYSFAQFICNDVEQLKRDGKRPKVLFLMRDGYLPSLACETLLEQPLGKRIRISRFTSFAASFRSKKEVNRYLREMIGSNRFKVLAEQLLLPEKVYAPLVTEAEKSNHPALKFITLIQQERILKIIFKKSAEFCARLIRHIKKEINLEAGDTLVLVDLGYSGTTQRLLGPILRDELGVEVIGRYLISLSVAGWKTSRQGLLDRSWCDERTMMTLVAYIALIEQLCTANEKSVIDYDENGDPIYLESSLSKQQYSDLDTVQAECLRFIEDAKKFFAATSTSISLLQYRTAALASMSRLLFLPSESEIQFLQSFQFELNLGTKDTYSLLDQAKGLTSLRQRGIFSLFLEKNDKKLRTNAPAELRAAGIELAITLMAQHRYYLDFGLKDVSFRREKINIIIMRGQQATQATIEALLTYDGFYSLNIPVGVGNLQVGILFGQKYQWIQFESAEMIRSNTYLSALETQYSENVWSNLIFEKMADKGGKLYECLSDSSFVMLVPSQKPDDEKKYIYQVVFRPIMMRPEK